MTQHIGLLGRDGQPEAVAVFTADLPIIEAAIRHE
jgi:hypothetical protein